MNERSVPSMDNNIITLLIIREVVLVVKDTEKLHAMNPSVEDHRTYFPNLDISIILFLHDLLSYFSKQSAPRLRSSMMSQCLPDGCPKREGNGMSSYTQSSL